MIAIFNRIDAMPLDLFMACLMALIVAALIVTWRK
jgi:hypothetical protein